MLDKFAPIVLFCYNRIDHLRQTTEALRANTQAQESRLYVFSDGSKGDSDRQQVAAVRQYLQNLSGFSEIKIFEADRNRGLAESIINGVSQVINTHGKVIILEDDLVTAPDFLTTMNELLNTFESRNDVFSVTGYAPPIGVPEHYRGDFYLAPRASSWGWGTWKSKWQLADWGSANYTRLLKDPALKTRFTAGGNDLWPMIYKQQHGIINSWAVRWCLSQAVNNAYGVYPVKSKVKNIGTDGSGTNFTFKTSEHDVGLYPEKLYPDSGIAIDTSVIRKFAAFYKMPFYLKIKNWVKFGLR